MKNFRQPLEEANKAFGQEEVARISLLKVKGPVEEMTLNAAGLIEAFRLGAIHCYKRFSKREARELLRQVRQLPVLDSVMAREILILAGQFIDLLSPKWEDEIWKSWAANMQRWGVEKLTFGSLSERDIKIFCGKALLLDKANSFKCLRRKLEKRSVHQCWETLWVGREFNSRLYEAFVKYNPSLSAFVEA